MAEPALIHPPQELLEGPAGKPMSYWKLVWWRLRRDKVTLTAAAVILCIVLSAVLAPYLAPYNPSQGSIRKRLAPVGTPGYMLGTDEQGRDMLSRLLYGGRLSLTAGVVPVCIALLAGATLGILAGFMGRWREHAHYAHHGHLLCLSLGPASHRHLGGPGGRRGEHDHRAVHCVYTAHHACGRKRHHAGTGLGVHGGSPGEWGWHRDDHWPSHDRQRRWRPFSSTPAPW